MAKNLAVAGIILTGIQTFENLRTSAAGPEFRASILKGIIDFSVIGVSLVYSAPVAVSVVATYLAIDYIYDIRKQLIPQMTIGRRRAK